MQLVRLQVVNDGSVFREINFKEGINIITNEEEDGNHIGKSTALRVLNFCLGSDGNNIWKDPDTRTVNERVVQFVTSGAVLFVLDMNVRGKRYCIKRKFFSLKQKSRTVIKRVSWINEHEYDTNDKFQEALAPILGLSTENPTYGSIKNRFVRIDKSTSRNSYRYLNVNTPDKDYIPYYSYIFGFAGHDELSQEKLLVEDCEDRGARVAALLNGSLEQEYKDRLKAIDDDIEVLNEKEESFDFKDSQNKAIGDLREHRKKIAQFSSDIANLEVRINYANRTISSYESKLSNIDSGLISDIYNEAKSIVPELRRSLEESIAFHEAVTRKKVGYVRRQLDELFAAYNELGKTLNIYLDDEKKLIKAIENESHLGGFIVIERELQDRREERGRFAFVVDEVSKEEQEIRRLKGEIDKLRESNKSHLSQLEASVELFNESYKAFTRALFGDFALSVNADTDSSTNELQFSIVNEEKVAGDGAPRAAAMAFDMALVAYVKRQNSRLPEFTIQDYLEPADQDKLAKLAYIANEKNIQVVVSVLHDKLQSLDDKFIQDNTVLWLKQSNKFFKID